MKRRWKGLNQGVSFGDRCYVPDPTSYVFFHSLTTVLVLIARVKTVATTPDPEPTDTAIVVAPLIGTIRFVDTFCKQTLVSVCDSK